MKRILLPFALLFITTLCYCQVTVTQSAFPKAGDVWTKWADYTDSNYVISAPSSTAQNWNYDTVFILSDTVQQHYLTASEVPYSNLVTGATLGLGSIGYSEFFNSNDSGFYSAGTYSLSDSGSYYSAMVWSPSELMLPVPFSYGNTRNYKSMAVVTGYDSIISSYSKQITVDVGTFTADAFGTITTRGVTNAPVLRLNNSYYEYDTSYIGHTSTTVDSLFDTSKIYYTSYYFVQNSSPYELMEIDLTSQSIMAAYYYTATSTNNSVGEINKSPVFTNVYPNPASPFSINFTIPGDNARWLRIYNMTGQCVETENVAGVNSLTVTNSLLRSGLYFYHITDNAGNIIGGNKFVVQ